MRFAAMTVVVLIAVPYIIAKASWATGKRPSNDYPPDLTSSVRILETERERADKLERYKDRVFSQFRASDRIIKRLISGDMTFSDAIAHLCSLRTKEELEGLLARWRTEPGQTNEDAVSTMCLSLVRGQLADSQDGKTVMARLEQEKAAYLRSGERIIPD
jgi:hypothetical protein